MSKQAKIKLQLLTSSQPAVSIQANPQKWINMFLIESNNEKRTKGPAVAYRTPGTELFADLSSIGPIRDLFSYRNVLYCIAGNKLCTVSPVGAVTQIGGTLDTKIGRCSTIQNNNNQILFVDGYDAYTYTLGDANIANVTDADFITAIKVTYLNGRGIYAKPNTGQIWFSAINDFADWPALNFVTAEANPDNLVAVHTRQKEILAFGENSTEVFVDTGDAVTPLQPQPNVLIPYGLMAPFSVADVENTVIFLGRNKLGKAQIILLDGYNPTPLLTESASRELETITTYDDAKAFCFQKNGHLFYALSFPTENKSYLLDVTTRNLIDWKSWKQEGADQAGNMQYSLGRHLSDCFISFANKLLVSDYRSGKILELKFDSFEDYNTGPDNSIYSSMTLPVLSDSREYVTIESIELDMERGSSELTLAGDSSSENKPLITISLSKDGGKSFGYKRIVNFGYQGEYNKRVRLNCWGTGRDLVIKIETNHPSMLGLIAVLAELYLQNGQVESI